MISIDKIPAFLQACDFYVELHDHAKWDLGPATSDVTPKRLLTKLQMQLKYFWVICDSYFIKTGQDV